MNEFIEKLIGRLEDVKDRANRHYNYGDEAAYHHAIEIVNQLAEEYKGGWIPCSERLPELETDVFICTKQNGIAIASLSKPDIFWTDEEGFHILDVIAWQPLPAHYQPENS